LYSTLVRCESCSCSHAPRTHARTAPPPHPPTHADQARSAIAPWLSTDVQRAHPSRACTGRMWVRVYVALGWHGVVGGRAVRGFRMREFVCAMLPPPSVFFKAECPPPPPPRYVGQACTHGWAMWARMCLSVCVFWRGRGGGWQVWAHRRAAAPRARRPAATTRARLQAARPPWGAARCPTARTPATAANASRSWTTYPVQSARRRPAAAWSCASRCGGPCSFVRAACVSGWVCAPRAPRGGSCIKICTRWCDRACR
jgi:hypothetical protein